MVTDLEFNRVQRKGLGVRRGKYWVKKKKKGSLWRIRVVGKMINCESWTPFMKTVKNMEKGYGC